MIPINIAHIDKDGKTQSLEDHLRITADWCARFALGEGLPNAARLIALLHDMGKAARQFSAYLLFCNANPDDNSLRGKITHSTQGAKFVYETYGAGDPLARLTASVAAACIAGHHGGLMDCVSPDGGQPLAGRLSKDDPTLCYEEVLQEFPLECSGYLDLDSLFQAATREIKAFTDQYKAQGLGGPFIFHLMVRLLFSCLIDADRYDAFCFEAGLAGSAAEPERPPWEELATRLEARLASMDAATPINAIRAEISGKCKEAARNPCGIYRLSVPTGGGKTLASLRFALEHARLYGKERIFYIIPFTTIIDQNAKEIREILMRDDLVLEHHSNVLPDRGVPDGGKAAGDEEEGEYKQLTERWSSPVILTTMVQFLNTLFAGGTRAARRMHHLANAVLIFDEIQAAPLNCIHLLNTALNFLSRMCNTTVLLCTATQPRLSAVDRPLLSAGVELVENPDEMFRRLRRTRVVDARRDGGYQAAELCNFLLAKLQGLNTGLAIFNTRRDARDFYRELCRRNAELPEDKQYLVCYLSTDLCPAHRKRIIEGLKRQLKSGRVVCVSTQLIEAGVDLSFQCVVRALAGLDSVAQAAGRCNRNKESDCRDVFVLNVSGENLKNLPGIRRAQEAARRVLEELRVGPQALGGDLIAPEAVNRYYQYYYDMPENKNLMDYPVTMQGGGKATLYDLLGKNTPGCGELERHGVSKPPLTQAFATAGELFHAIEEDTRAVLVPFGEGAALIERLRNAGSSASERVKDLRLAQQYSVNVFSETLQRLERERALEALSGSVLALDKRYYDDQIGVTTQGKPMDYLGI